MQDVAFFQHKIARRNRGAERLAVNRNHTHTGQSSELQIYQALFNTGIVLSNEERTDGAKGLPSWQTTLRRKKSDKAATERPVVAFCPPAGQKSDRVGGNSVPR